MDTIFETSLSAAFENFFGDVIVKRPDFTSRKTLFLIVPPTPSIGPLPWCASLNCHSRWKWLRHKKKSLDLNCDAHHSFHMCNFVNAPTFSSIWLIVLCMNDRAVTRECLFNSVNMVIGVVWIYPFVHV